MKVRTLRPVYYGGREYQKGEVIDVNEKRARSLLRLRRVESMTADEQPAAQERFEESSQDEAPRRAKRQYRRRDMTAESE